MRIRCPSCSATYEVPDTLLERPRTVRCAKCAQDWMATPIADDPMPELVADTVEEATEAPAVPVHQPVVHEPVAREQVAGEAIAHEPFHDPETELGITPLSAIERLSAPLDLSPRIRRHDRFLTAAWAGSFAILAALGVAGYTKRDVLMREWPASKRVYSTLGLAPLDAKTRDRKNASDSEEH